MTKMIKVEDVVYDQLSRLKGQRDTFSHVLKRLLAIQVNGQGMTFSVDNLVMALHDLAAEIRQYKPPVG